MLKDEIQIDPLNRGYSAMNKEEIVISMNTPNRPRNKTSMTGREVMDQIDETEYNGLSDTLKGQFLALVSGDSLDPFGFAKNVIVGIFSGSSNTVSNLQAAREEQISRAQELGLVVNIGTLQAENI